MGRILAHTDLQGRIQRFLNDTAGDRLATRVAGSQGGSDTDWQRSGEHEGTRYRFNRAGNLTRREDGDGLLELDWDANQRLIASHRRGADGQRRTTRYAYDPLGRRLWKETAGARTAFGWDGDALALDAAHGAAREFVYRPETFEPLAMLRGTNTQALHYINDPNGCPVRLIDSAGHIQWAARHQAWGGIAQLQVNQVDNPLRLQGQYEDGETGLHYNRYRYYAPQIGAFISQDPLGLAAGVNVHDFAPNALGWVDPLGLSGKCGGGEAATGFVKDFATKNTKNWSAMFKSEGEARALARTRLGKNAVKVEPGKLRSADGVWQYRAKPGDVGENHIHLEQLNPKTGEVLQNLHLRWPKGAGR